MALVVVQAAIVASVRLVQAPRKDHLIEILGPKYCGDGCSSNCNATAPCGQYHKVPGTTCPLNTCCSEWGFCGTSAEFCNAKCRSNCEAHPKPMSRGGQVLDNG